MQEEERTLPLNPKGLFWSKHLIKPTPGIYMPCLKIPWTLINVHTPPVLHAVKSKFGPLPSRTKFMLFKVDKGNDQEPIQSNSTPSPKHQTGKGHLQLKRHLDKNNTSEKPKDGWMS